jgi:hypothetical protein
MVAALGTALILILAFAGAARAQTATTAPATPTTEAGTTGTTAAPAGTAPGLVPLPPDGEALNPGVSFEQISVQAWPEYDQPGTVLVLVDVLLPEDASFPFKFRFAVPKGANVTGVAEVTSDGSFVYDRPAPQFDRTQPDRDIISVEIPKLRTVRLEWYFDLASAAEGPRDFNLVYEVPGDTQQLSVSIQEPARSSDFSVTPPLADSSSDQQGFNYVGQVIGAAQGGDSLQYQVVYSKDDAEASVSGAEGTTGTGGNSSYLLILLVLLVVGVGGFAVYRLWFRPQPVTRGRGGSRRPAPTRPASRGKSKPAVQAGARPAGGLSRFCTNCGAELSKRDKFCPECGTPRG